MTEDGVPGAGPLTEPDPLTPSQRAALSRGRRELEKVLRPARLSTLTLWTVAVFGGLTVLWGGLVSGGGGVVVGAALLAVAWNERRGRDRLRELDPEGARILGWNQLALAAVVTIYGVLAIAGARTGPDPSLRELEDLVGFDPRLVAELTTIVYGAVIVLVDVAQALFARYYFGRAPVIEAFRRETPGWVVELLR